MPIRWPLSFAKRTRLGAPPATRCAGADLFEEVLIEERLQRGRDFVAAQPGTLSKFQPRDFSSLADDRNEASLLSGFDLGLIHSERDSRAELAQYQSKVC